MFTPAAHTEADRLVEPLRGGIGLVDLQDALVVQRLAEHVKRGFNQCSADALPTIRRRDRQLRHGGRRGAVQEKIASQLLVATTPLSGAEEHSSWVAALALDVHRLGCRETLPLQRHAASPNGLVT